MGELGFLRDGGYAMYFTLFWGLVGLGFAAFFATRPTRGRFGFLQGLQSTILGSSLVGTVFGCMGVSRAFQGCVEQPDCVQQSTTLLVAGLGEAVANLALGLVFFTLLSFVGAFGRLRLP